MKWMQLKELRGSWIVTFYVAFILHRTGVNVWLSTWLLRKLQSTFCEQLSICVICSSSIRTLFMSMTSELVENCFQLQVVSFFVIFHWKWYNRSSHLCCCFLFLLVLLFSSYFSIICLNHEQSKYFLGRLRPRDVLKGTVNFLLFRLIRFAFVFVFALFYFVLLFFFLFCFFISNTHICTCTRWYLKEVSPQSNITWHEMRNKMCKPKKVYHNKT